MMKLNTHAKNLIVRACVRVLCVCVCVCDV
jgi:hypothetical protein